MRRYVRKRKGSAEALVVPTAAAARRKSGIISPELSRSSIQHKTRRLAVEKPEDSASPASSGNSSVNSGHVLASCCSSTKFADLEENEEVTVDILAGNLVDFRDSKEKTLSINDQAESGELESTAMALESKSRCRSVAEEMPTEAELEEFFATAEANLQKQFIDKFNYDIVKDEPLEGRYEWIQIQFSPLEES